MYDPPYVFDTSTFNLIQATMFLMQALEELIKRFLLFIGLLAQGVQQLHQIAWRWCETWSVTMAMHQHIDFLPHKVFQFRKPLLLPICFRGPPQAH
jgi:hypothetical protein